MVTITIWFGFQNHYHICFKVNIELHLRHYTELKNEAATRSLGKSLI
jgi:hypothetical protein